MKRKLNVLVACESSGTVREAFRKLGHNAWSCDLLPADDGSPYHLQGNVLKFLKAQAWDLMIAHPPCTYLCNSGVTHLYKFGHSRVVRYGYKSNGGGLPSTPVRLNYERSLKLEEACKFFVKLLKAKIPHIAIENPIQHCWAKQGINTYLRQHISYDQIVQPWMFGHMEQKATCLWLKDLPKLVPTKDVKAATKALPRKQRMRLHYLSPSKDRWKIRSKTFEGIAQAMAEQWSKYIIENEQFKNRRSRLGTRHGASS